MMSDPLKPAQVGNSDHQPHGFHATEAQKPNSSHSSEAENALLGILRRACRGDRTPAPKPKPVPDSKGYRRLRNSIEKYWIGLLHEAFSMRHSPRHMGNPITLCSPRLKRIKNSA